MWCVMSDSYSKSFGIRVERICNVLTNVLKSCKGFDILNFRPLRRDFPVFTRAEMSPSLRKRHVCSFLLAGKQGWYQSLHAWRCITAISHKKHWHCLLNGFNIENTIRSNTSKIHGLMYSLNNFDWFRIASCCTGAVSNSNLSISGTLQKKRNCQMNPPATERDDP